jgi:hypothetical protein
MKFAYNTHSLVDSPTTLHHHPVLLLRVDIHRRFLTLLTHLEGSKQVSQLDRQPLNLRRQKPPNLRQQQLLNLRLRKPLKLAQQPHKLQQHPLQLNHLHSQKSKKHKSKRTSMTSERIVSMNFAISKHFLSKVSQSPEVNARSITSLKMSNWIGLQQSFTARKRE